MKKGIMIALIFSLLTSILAAAASNQTTLVLTPTGLKPIPSQLSVWFAARFNMIKSWGFWLKTRDYASLGRNIFKWIAGLSLAIKIIAVVLFLVLLIIIWNYALRNSRANNLRRARRHHLLGEQAHKRGDENKAKYHYERASHYREKAQEQW